MAMGQFMPFGARGKDKVPLSYTFLNAYNAGRPSGSVSALNVDLGPPSDNRIIVIGVAHGRTGALASVTIGDIQADFVYAAGDNNYISSIAYAVVPEGVADEVVLTFPSRPTSEVGVVVYAVYNASSPPVISQGSASGGAEVLRTTSGVASVQSVLFAVSSTASTTPPPSPWGGDVSEDTAPVIGGAVMATASDIVEAGPYSATYASTRSLISLSVG